MYLHNNEERILDNPIETLDEYAEGDQLLNKALLTCFKYNLMTEGCCKDIPKMENYHSYQ